MNLTLNTSIGGYFTYRIYKESSGKIVYQSPQRKNLIVDSGLEFLYDNSINNIIKVLDLGVSSQAVSATDTGIVGNRFPSASYFTNLSALSVSATADYNTNTSSYTAFFRTRSTPRTLRLKEFCIKPGSDKDAFARQLLDVKLDPGYGLEFTYEVKVQWPCGIQTFDMPFTYRIGLSGEEYNVTKKQNFDKWEYSSQSNNKEDWVSLAVGGDTYVAVASSNVSTTGENIIYSTNTKQWEDVTLGSNVAPFTQSSSALQFNDVVFGIDPFTNNNQFVAVGNNVVAISDNTLTEWVKIDPAKDYNWTGVTFGYATTDLNAPGRYLAVSNTGENRVMYSDTGTDWLTGGDSITNNIGWKSVAYGPVSGFVAVANSGDYKIAYSSTGTEWASARSPQDNSWTDIVYGNGFYVAVSNDGSLRSMYADETDLTKWYAVATPEQNSWCSLAYGNGVFAAISPDGTNRIIYTTDLDTWTAVDTLCALSWSSIEYDSNNSRFIAMARSEDVYSAYSIFIDIDTYPTTTVPVSASIIQIPTDGKVNIDDTFYMYTVKSIDLRECEQGALYSSLDYSTGDESNSYAKVSNSFVYPNSSINSFIFGPLSGYGPIKGIMLTKQRARSTTSSISSAHIGVQWDMPDFLQSGGNETVGGTQDDPTLIQGVDGALNKPLAQGDNIPESPTLQINIFNRWGRDRTGAVRPAREGDVNDLTVRGKGFIDIDMQRSPWRIFYPGSNYPPVLMPTIVDSADPNTNLILALVSDEPVARSSRPSLDQLAYIQIEPPTLLISYYDANNYRPDDVINGSITESDFKDKLQTSIKDSTGIIDEVTNVEFRSNNILRIYLNGIIAIDRAEIIVQEVLLSEDGTTFLDIVQNRISFSRQSV